MSRNIQFRRHHIVTEIALPFDLDAVLQSWHQIRTIMLKHVPPEFTRDEWAYIVSFLAKETLLDAFSNGFGVRIPQEQIEIPSYIARPVSLVSVWLPNNVSLLGPLMLILLSLSGTRIRMKAGSRSSDLTGVFLAFLLENCPDGQLYDYLQDKVVHSAFGREDERNASMAKEARVRIVFGSNEAIDEIEHLPHPVGSQCFAFGDHRSEAWLESGTWNQSTVVDLIKVFSIYGQAGCTSPSRVVIIDGTPEEAVKLRDAIELSWPRISRNDPPAHLASANIAGWQIDRVHEWDAKPIERNLGVVSIGHYGLHAEPTIMNLRIFVSSFQNAVDNLPENIQTIGHVLGDAGEERWVSLITRSKILRFVPLRNMHNFSSVWDGNQFWTNLFDHVQFAS